MGRSCPVCKSPLNVLVHDGVELDKCPECDGLFLEVGEGESLAAAIEPERWRDSFAASPRGSSKRACPVDGRQMELHRVEYGRERVDVDLCPECGGMWLDRGEIETLREVVIFARGAGRRRMLGIDRPGFGSYLFQLFTGLPIEAWNPVRRKPWALYGLMIGLCLAYLGEVAFVMTQGADALVSTLLLVPDEVLRGRTIWTVFTSGFLHAGIPHLVGNLYFLKVFGDNIEDQLGAKRFLLLYLTALFGGSALHVLTHVGDATPALGASGAISGLLGAYMILFPRARLWIVLLLFRFRVRVWLYFGLWAVWQVLMGLVDEAGVAWFAHLGGFVVGVVGALWLRRHSKGIHPLPTEG